MSTEREKKKIEIGAVIEFCSAKGFQCTRTEIFRFFGVLQPTGSRWFPSTWSPSDRGVQQPGNQNGPPTSPTPGQQLPTLKRQNPVRNDGRGRKRLKTIIEGLESDVEDDGSLPPLSPPAPARSSSPSLSEGPITPSSRKIAQPSRSSGQRDGHQVKEESMVEIKSEV